MVDIIGTLNIVDMLESKNDKIKVEKITKSKDEVSETINENEVTSDMTTKEVDSQEKVIEADVSEVIDTEKLSEEAKVYSENIFSGMRSFEDWAVLRTQSLRKHELAELKKLKSFSLISCAPKRICSHIINNNILTKMIDSTAILD